MSTDKTSGKHGRDDKGRFVPGHKEGFQPGNNANPEGRPKRKTLTELLVTQLDEVCPSDKHGRTWGEVIVTATLAHGVKGQTGALQEVWNRSDGKVASELALSGEVDINGNAKHLLNAKISALTKRGKPKEDTPKSD